MRRLAKPRVPSRTEIVITPDENAEQAVFDVRAQLGPSALLPLTRHPRAEVREQACAGLAGHVEGDLAPRTIPALLACSHDPDPSVRAAALRSLEGACAPEVADRLLEALRDPHLPACLAAARCLFYRPDTRARPQLEALLDRPSPAMTEVIEALSALPGTTPLLRSLCLGDHEERALEAVFGLALKHYPPNRCLVGERQQATEVLREIGQLRQDQVGECARLYLSQAIGPHKIDLRARAGLKHPTRTRRGVVENA